MRRDSRHSRRLVRWLAPLLTLALVVAASATAYELGYVEEWLDTSPATAPADPPSESSEPWESPVPSPTAVAGAARAAVPDPAKVRAALAGPLGDSDLGPHVLAEIAPLGGGDAVYAQGKGAAVPASTTKLLTSLAALDALGPETTFTTEVVRTAPGRIVLVGGGDPLLGSKPGKDLYPARADLRTLAAHTAAALQKAGVTRVRLGFDDSLFSGPTTSPQWRATYLVDEVSPITALWADQGNNAAGRRESDPSQAAAAIFAHHLRATGITVRGTIRRSHGTGSTVARVESAPLREIVQHTLETSDNDAAEVLAHHVGARLSGAGSFDGGVAGTLATLTKLAVPTDGLRLYDGSGLSREDRISTATLTGVLRVAAQRPELAAVLGGLSVAGFTGSLVGRFEDAASAPGLGMVRAKTGTLTGVHALAGTVTDLDGDVMTLVLMTDKVAPARTLGARQALDDAAAALAGCHCAAAAPGT